MDSIITAEDLAADLTSILDRIGQRGERFVVERDGEPIAVLTPAQAPTTITLRDIATRLQNLAHPDDRFADELEAVQRDQPQAEPPFSTNI